VKACWWHQNLVYGGLNCTGKTFHGYSLIHAVGDNVQEALDGRVLSSVYAGKEQKVTGYKYAENSLNCL